MIGNKELIRNINSRLVLETIFNSPSISRADLSKKLGLTKSTISSIVLELIHKNLVLEIGNDNTSMGRKPILLSFYKEAGYVISIDLGDETISALLTNLQGEKYQLKQIKNPKGFLDILNSLIVLIESMRTLAPRTPLGLIGISLCMPKVISYNKAFSHPHYHINPLDLPKKLEEYFDIDVLVESQSNLAVMAEQSFFYEYPSIANLNISSRIGLGLYINHTFYTGFHGLAGDLGHSTIEINGKPCPCGNRGCLEQYLSQPELLKVFAKRKGLPHVDFSYFSSQYRTFDKDALEVMDLFVLYTTICVNNIISAYDPHVIVINSLFTTLEPKLINQIQESLTTSRQQLPLIVPSRLQNSSVLIGGSYLSIQKFLGIKKLKFFPSFPE